MQEVFLNLLPNGVPPVCYISQYDGTSRVIRFHLLNGTEPLTLNGSETITLNFRKPDREEVTLAIENTSSNYIDLAIPSELSDKYGEGSGEFRIQGLGTLSFKMYIESDAYGDSLKTRSISGPIATFETDLAEDLIKLDVDLEPIQDLHGYSNPWVGGAGKNLIVPIDRTFTNNGVSCVCSASAETVSLNGTASNSGGRTQKMTKDIVLPAGTYMLSTIAASGTRQAIYFVNRTDNNTYISTTLFTLEEETSVYVGANVVSDTEYNETVRLQIEKGSTATDWTPYENICPISGHDSAILSRVGKNWLNLNRTNIITNSGLYPSTTRTFSENDIWVGISRNNYFNNARISSYSIDSNKITVLTTAGGYGVGFPVMCKPSTAYKMSNKEGYSIGIGFFDVDGNYLSDTTGSTFTTPNNCVWILVVFSGTANVETSYTDPQLELGSTATDYEPYTGTEVTVQFGQTVYKGKLDSARRKIIVYFTGRAIKTFPWTYNDTEYDFGYFATGNTVDKAYNTNFICECFKSIDKARGSLKNGELAVYNLTNAARRFTVRYDAISTVEALLEQFGDYLICYELAEPIEIDLTQVQTASIDSTPVASFETTLAMPLNTSEHSFSCSQAEGTPTPDSPIPITGVSEIKVFRTGKNLITANVPTDREYWGTSQTDIVDAINSLPVGTYTISNKFKINELPSNGKVDHGRIYITAMVNGSQVPVTTYNVVTDNSPTLGKIYSESGTFTITEENKGKINHAYLYCDQSTTHSGTGRGKYDFYDLQVELGSTATPYEPYSGESVTVSLGGTYYGGKLVQSEDGNRKLILSWGTCDLGNATYQYNSTYNVFISDYHTIEPYAKDNFIAKCQIYDYKGSYNVVKNNNMSFGYIYNSQFCFRDDRYNQDPSAFKAGVSGVYVYYELVTPIEINLPDGDPLNAVVGENNVYCNTGDTALTYYYNMVADPIRIPALVGTNNVYSDAGDVDVEYYTTLEGGND